MVSERDEAKGQIIKRDADDSELESTLGAAHRYQLEVTKEQNRHVEATRDKDLGFFGRYLGGEKNAPTAVAMLVVFVGFGVGIGCLIAAGMQVSNAEFWAKQAERGFSLGAAALAYIFGRGSN